MGWRLLMMWGTGEARSPSIIEQESFSPSFRVTLSWRSKGRCLFWCLDWVELIPAPFSDIPKAESSEPVEYLDWWKKVFFSYYWLIANTYNTISLLTSFISLSLSKQLSWSTLDSIELCSKRLLWDLMTELLSKLLADDLRVTVCKLIKYYFSQEELVKQHT